jgi:hypothetical protein
LTSAGSSGEWATGRLVRLLVSSSPQFGAVGVPGVPGVPDIGVGGRSVHLIVTEDDFPDRDRLNVYVHEVDFPTLVRGHPREVDAYLRPVLRELGQESVFAPDPAIAWEIFADEWAVPAKLKQDVAAQVAQLGASDAKAREAASQALARLGRDGALAILQLDRADLSPEQDARLDAVVAAQMPLPRTEAARLRKNVAFLLDCLNSDDRAIRVAALKRLRSVRSPKIEFDVDLVPPARGDAVAELRDKVRP